MSICQVILAQTSAMILSLIVEPASVQCWDTASEPAQGQESWRIVTVNHTDHDQEEPQIAMNLAVQASILVKHGKHAEAERLLKRSLEIASHALGTGHLQVAMLLNRLANLYVVQRRYTEAEGHLRHSLEINERILGPDHLDVAANLEALAFVLRKAHREEEARHLETRALEIWSKHRDDLTFNESQPPPG